MQGYSRIASVSEGWIDDRRYAGEELYDELHEYGENTDIYGT